MCLTTETNENLANSETNVQNILSECHNLTQHEKKNFHTLLLRYRSLFSDAPGKPDEYVHTIRLVNKKPFCLKQYPISLAHRDAVRCS